MSRRVGSAAIFSLLLLGAAWLGGSTTRPAEASSPPAAPQTVAAAADQVAPNGAYMWNYSVKFVCGRQQPIDIPGTNAGGEPPVNPGNYATEINIHNYAYREFKLRKKLFFPLVPAVCHKCDVPFTKVHRALGTIESIKWEGEKSATKKEAALKKAMDGFWGDEDLSDYFAERFRELNRLDPNAFIIVEFGEFNHAEKRAQP